MDVAGFGYDGFTDDQRQTIVAAIHEAMISRTGFLMRSMKEWRRPPRHTHLARADASACSPSITSEGRCPVVVAANSLDLYALHPANA
jgi:hypothetical protein